MHFCGQVFVESKEPPQEDDLYPILEPYWEGTENPDFLEFVDRTDEVVAKWEEVKDSGQYKDMEDMAGAWFGYKNKNGRYGYHSNPDARWDWFSIGGRWGSGKDVIKAKNFVLDESTPEESERLRKVWDLLMIDGKWDEDQKKEAEKLGLTVRIYKPEYYKEKYGNVENYIEAQSKNYPFCFIDTEGQWHEQGEIGWFTDNVTEAGLNQFHKAFVDEIEKAKQSKRTIWMVTVDFHI